jgi:UDP-N-acetylglucosamine 2-epimerase (non-hydrolysing)
VERLDSYFAAEKPDLVLVQGDTTTVFCATLAAFYHRVPVGHVEAGLRTGDLASPWPEEANRVLTSRLASMHFAPTTRARDNLLRERIPPDHIFVTGNTGIDALFLILQRQRQSHDLAETTASWNGAGRMVLITAHRRENFGRPFEEICSGIAELARRFTDTAFIYPVHRNPSVVEVVDRVLRSQNLPNVYLVPPLSYPEFVSKMSQAALILTDSGGVQEEAPSLGKPVLVVREKTERPEGVAAGTVRVVGPNRGAIVEWVTRLLSDPAAYAAMTRAHNPYGDGHAAERIVRACLDFLGLESAAPPMLPFE